METARYARRHDDGHILCWRARCGFCFGEAVPVRNVEGGAVLIDPGFVLVPAGEVDATVRRSGLSTDVAMLGYALSSPARRAYQDAKWDRTTSSFRAPGRHGQQAFPVLEDARIACPEHGWQVVSPEHLGALTTTWIEQAGRTLEELLHAGR